MLDGSHLIKSWSRTQAVVALSSAEAELYGCIKATALTLGVVSLYGDLGVHTTGAVLTDASATLSRIRKKGLGKSRHVHTSDLWVQDAHAQQIVDDQKVPGKDHASDALTKHVPADTLN